MSERRIESTKEMLVRELGAANIQGSFVGRAQSGQFSDFESEHPAPKTLLVMLLQSRAEHCTTVRERKRLTKFAKRVMAGEFDDTKEEAAAWVAKEGLALLSNQGLPA